MRIHPILILAALLLSQPLAAQGVISSPRQRLIVLTDIENEPDDAQSIVRLLLYSNQIDIRGIVATTSTHLRNRIVPEQILKEIDAYEKVRPNLLLHEAGYPEASTLRAMVKKGLPRYGMNGVGKGMDSEGSELIVAELKRNDDNRPLWVTAWGGTNVLAQALWKIRNTESRKEQTRLLSKLRVYTISDQDDSGAWIRSEFPEVFYIVTPGKYERSAWIGMGINAPLVDNDFVSPDWLARNIQQGHGPLGACYPDVAYSMEGDTPSFLGLIPNGLNDMEHPDWGGWGGRHILCLPPYGEYKADASDNFQVPVSEEKRPIWVSAQDTFIPSLHGVYRRTEGMPEMSTGVHESLFRWRTEFQNDMAARMDWCIEDYAQANHPPHAIARVFSDVPNYGEDNRPLVEIKDGEVTSGEFFQLDASLSSDPDGDSLSYLWFQYTEAGSWNQYVPLLGAPNMSHVKVQAPSVQKEETIHFILKVTDKGTPALSRYGRVIIRVKP